MFTTNTDRSFFSPRVCFSCSRGFIYVILASSYNNYVVAGRMGKWVGEWQHQQQDIWLGRLVFRP